MLPVIRQALRSIRNPNFFALEESYQGELLAEIRTLLPNAGLPGDAIIQQEYQKKLALHGIRIRPDLVVHVPAAIGGNRQLNNFAAFELKRAAGPTAVERVFQKLDLMIQHLDYPLAIFLNVNTSRTQAVCYNGRFPERLHCFAVKVTRGQLQINHSHWRDGGLVHETERLP